jgi:GTPase SAR1 family protein
MGNIFPKGQDKNVLMFGLEKAGKTHMLYSWLVGEGGMHTIKKLKETHGMNYEHISGTQADFEVWDIGGNQMLRKNWKLYLKNVPAASVIFVVNISEDIERIRESKNEFHKLMSEPML